MCYLLPSPSPKNYISSDTDASSMSVEELWEQTVKDAGEAGFTYKELGLPRVTVRDAERCRHMCEQNVCKCYGTNWGCPPGAGSIATCNAKIKKFRNAAVVYRRCEVDIKDADALKSLSGKLQNLLRSTQDALRARGYECMCLSDGGCNYCGKCNYPDECRHPDKRVDSVSAYGILLMEYLEDNGLQFKFEEDHVTFYGLIFYNEPD